MRDITSETIYHTNISVEANKAYAKICKGIGPDEKSFKLFKARPYDKDNNKKIIKEIVSRRKKIENNNER